MSTTFIGITYDARDAERVARFWGAVLGRRVADGASTEHATVLAADPDGGGPRISFHQVPESKTVKNRLHIDLMSTDPARELERILGLGATIVAEQSVGDLRWTTLADPEGNEFDLIAGLA
ncbi:VOC family protein [Aeromicrobium chenweiae]|uniref:Glyoxalase/bleomycin resistance/dioxygenase family protein n=1 Tax=Aeromicrobium chenweiae TaxID=2079793 RepID=A0A2S0WLG6_9ACTN|nr:VOC family protein [Aeromicrobium chenweiae]AWB92114.1 glyoxalase/bleomycin resistance/dioxygenase family protein [Aeromicrobium chenweiae]TGN32963.1 VOC family protein [Aeromicrobium chenweiae]